MKLLPELHLSAEQILIAVVDERDLSETNRFHLAHCDQCAQAQAETDNLLVKFSHLADHYTPSPMGAVRIDVGRRGLFPSFLRYAKVAFGLAATALLMVIVWSSMTGLEPARFSVENGEIGPIDDAAFMADVARLVDDPLPVGYRDLIGSSIVDSDEDFMDFIVPPVTGDGPITIWRCGKGAPPC
jgi:hypothetical protein